MIKEQEKEISSSKKSSSHRRTRSSPHGGRPVRAPRQVAACGSVVGSRTLLVVRLCMLVFLFSVSNGRSRGASTYTPTSPPGDQPQPRHSPAVKPEVIVTHSRRRWLDKHGRPVLRTGGRANAHAPSSSCADTTTPFANGPAAVGRKVQWRMGGRQEGRMVDRRETRKRGRHECKLVTVEVEW